MQVTGKVIIMQNATYERDDVKEDAIATIELPLVDVSKIKEGDEVWIRAIKVKDMPDITIQNTKTRLLTASAFVAHLPKLKQEEYNREMKIPEKIEDLREYPQNIITYKINEIIEYLKKKK